MIFFHKVTFFWRKMYCVDCGLGIRVDLVLSGDGGNFELSRG